ncbi:MAG: hypothetical protein RL205_1025 [Actinomycetota bacterium]|jgi:formiminoglutamase
MLPVDERWPRAAHAFTSLAEGAVAEQGSFVILGVPAHTTSISPTRADRTPEAVRAALFRYSTYSATAGRDIRDLTLLDAGDVTEPDGDAGEARVMSRVSGLRDAALLMAIGGDNSITHSVMRGVFGDELGQAGLITLDAHHDLRDGVSNGSPVRRLVEAGLAGTRVVQIGISDFANSAEYAARARDMGITVITRGALRTRPMADAMSEALEIAGAGGAGIHVDLDVDVCDRAVVPACPAAAPGGISADELRQAASIAASDARVRSMDLAEIDATIDSADQRTVRLAALCILEAAAGVLSRS